MFTKIKSTLFVLPLFLVILLSSENTLAQFRHIKGISAIELSGGITGKGYYGSASYLKYLSDKLYFAIPARYEMGNLNDSIKFTEYGIAPDLNYSLFKTQWLYASIKAGASATMMNINSASYEEFSYAVDKKSFLVLAGMIGVELEIYVHDKISLIPSFRQNLIFKSEVDGKSSYYAGFGIRYSIL